LRESERLNHDQALVQMHLGIAYLLHPSGTSDFATSEQYFTRALALVEREQQPEVKFAVLANAAVDAFRRGDRRKEEMLWQQAAILIPKVGREQTEIMMKFNRAFAAGNRATGKETFALWEEILQVVPPSSTWWRYGYARYLDICKVQKRQAKSTEDLAGTATTQYRPLVEVSVNKTLTISLQDTMADAQKRLGASAVAVPVIQNTILRCLAYPQYGLDIIGTSDVLVIRLHGSAAPPLHLQPRGPGTKAVVLRLGMPVKEVRALLGRQDSSTTLIDDAIEYLFYRDIGLGIRVEDAVVTEWLVMRVPILSAKA
jgi:hypothetical protein